MPGPVSYAATSDMQAYLPDVPTAQQTLWAGFLDIGARAIDEWCERIFYSDGASTKYFDVPGDPTSGTIISSLRLPDQDFYSLTALKIATRENADPAVTGDWITLTGDGITPPSDFYLEPANRPYVGAAGDSNRRPFYRVVIPATPPVTSSTYQSGFMPGKRTAAISATWGWPSIPAQIKDINTKIGIRMFKAAPTGFAGATGAPDVAGNVIILNYTDMNDRATLNRFKKWSAG